MARELVGLVALWLLASTSCVFLADPEVGAGLGASCVADDECQGASCLTGICAIGCAESSGCPGGSVCATGLCQLPLDVTLVYPSNPETDALTRAFEIGRVEVGSTLGYVTSEAELDKPLASDAAAAAESAIARGADVVLATSQAQSGALAALASAHPEVTVAVFRGSGPGIVRLDARAYQAYYLAGIAAAQVTASNRLGFIASVPDPAVVASVNAFALGAQRELGDAVTIEVRWLGAAHDPAPPPVGDPLEASLAAELVAAGSDVVAHSLDNDRALRKIEALRGLGGTARAVGANVEDACSNVAPGTCVGATYYRFAPVLEALLEGVHRQSLGPDSIVLGLAATETASAVGFKVDPALDGAAAVAATVDAVRVTLATDPGVGSIFDGPLRSTGQCEGETPMDPCVAPGERLSQSELDGMCWLVVGVVDAAGQPALVPGGCGD